MTRWISVMIAFVGACKPSPVEEVREFSAVTTVDVHETRDVAYRDGGHPKHKLDVYAPQGLTKVPVVHFIHGGYWVSGDRIAPDHGPGLYATLGRALARRGIVTIIQSYRLAPEVPIEAMLDDVRDGLGWSYANTSRYGGDPQRIYLMGHSAGGHLALMTAVDKPVVGIIAMSAIWDVVDMHDTQGASFNASVTYPVFGQSTERMRALSPMTHLGADTTPTCILTAQHDFGYMLPQAERAYRLLFDEGATVSHRVIDGYDHLDMVRRFGTSGDLVLAQVVHFISH